MSNYQQVIVYLTIAGRVAQTFDSSNTFWQSCRSLNVIFILVIFLNILLFLEFKFYDLFLLNRPFALFRLDELYALLHFFILRELFPFKMGKRLPCYKFSIDIFYIQKILFQAVSAFNILQVHQYFTIYNFHEYLIQHSVKSGGTKYHFRWVKRTWYNPLLKGLSSV